MYQTTAQKAATIRAALKSELGLNSRAVSVRCSAGGHSINVEVLAPIGDKFEQIKRIANAQESVRYDERSGEILSGGNTFVFVSFSSAMIDAEAKNYHAWLDSIPVADRNSTRIYDSGVRGEGSKIYVGRTEHGFTWKGMTWRRDQIARSIALYKLAAGPSDEDTEDDDREPESAAEVAPVAEPVAAPSIALDVQAFAADFQDVPTVDLETLRRMAAADDAEQVEILAAWIRGEVAPEPKPEPVMRAFFEAPGEPFELTALGVRAALAVGWSGATSGTVERFH